MLRFNEASADWPSSDDHSAWPTLPKPRVSRSFTQPSIARPCRCGVRGVEEFAGQHRGHSLVRSVEQFVLRTRCASADYVGSLANDSRETYTRMASSARSIYIGFAPTEFSIIWFLWGFPLREPGRPSKRSKTLNGPEESKGMIVQRSRQKGWMIHVKHGWRLSNCSRSCSPTSGAPNFPGF